MPNQHDALVKSVSVEKIAAATCAFYIGKRRVGFVGLANPAPISWLSNRVVKLPLQTAERIAVVQRVRELVEDLRQQAEEEEQELRRLEKELLSSEQPEEPEELPPVDQE